MKNETRKPRLYLAYGSNLNKVQMLRRCPGARLVGKGEIPGWKLIYKGSQTGAYLTIEPEDGSSVPVGVWEVTQDDERNLDHYEGYPVFYGKKDFRVEATLTDGTRKKLDSFAYVMTEGAEYALPSMGYVKVCLQGYLDFGFDFDVLSKAFRDTLEIVEKHT